MLLLVFACARLGEIRTLKWSYVDIGWGVLALPDSKTGAKNIHLNSAAIGILNSLVRIKSTPYVLPGHITESCLVNIRKPWLKIRKIAGLNDLRIRDLRHSFASIAVVLGVSLPIIGGLLEHTQVQTTARYAHVGNGPAVLLNELTGHKIAIALTKNEPEKKRCCQKNNDCFG